MAKILEASCSAVGVVTCMGVVIDNAVVLSLGTKASTGVLIIDEDDVFYVTSNATDIKSTIESVAGLVTQIIAILTALNTAAVAGQAAAIATLTTAKTTFNATKDTIK